MTFPQLWEAGNTPKMVACERQHNDVHGTQQGHSFTYTLGCLSLGPYSSDLSILLVTQLHFLFKIFGSLILEIKCHYHQVYKGYLATDSYIKCNPLRPRSPLIIIDWSKKTTSVLIYGCSIWTSHPTCYFRLSWCYGHVVTIACVISWQRHGDR